MDEIEPFPVTRLCRLPPAPAGGGRWLVEGLWAEGAVGCIGGHPKAGKTWLALELALAVASGKPCLGRFAVPKKGLVLVFCAEDDPSDVRARVAGLASARGVDFDKLPIGWIGAHELALDQPTDRRRLTRTVGDIKPRLLVLDPLVRLHHGDENSAAEVSELLGFLRGLQRSYGVAIALVHHVRKSGAAQPGTALRGSGDLHAWGDSNLYLVRKDGQPALIAEHRANRPPEPFGLKLDGEPPRLVIDPVGAPSPNPLDERIIRELTTAARVVTRTELRERLGVRNENLGTALDRLLGAGRVLRVPDGLTVPVPALGDRRERNEPRETCVPRP